MKEKDFKYMIYRIYSATERPDVSQRSIFYGWTQSKVVRDAFLQQRSKGKYKCVKMYDEDIARYYAEDVSDNATRIDMLKLQSAKTGDEFIFFMTANELKQTEIDIHQMLENAARLDRIDEDLEKLVEFYTSLNDYYADALAIIGFRPPEIRYMYPGADDECDLTSSEYDIEETYVENYSNPQRGVKFIELGPQSVRIDQLADRIVYSLESFVKVMKDNL